MGRMFLDKMLPTLTAWLPGFAGELVPCHTTPPGADPFGAPKADSSAGTVENERRISGPAMPGWRMDPRCCATLSMCSREAEGHIHCLDPGGNG